MENKVYNVAGHTVEFGNGSSSLDPWTRQYARENGVSLMTTCDCREWMLVDGESLYCLRSSSPVYQFHKYLEDNVIDSEEAFQLWLDTEIAGGMSHWKAESLAASKKEIDRLKAGK